MVELTQEIVRELLDYNPDTGELFWKFRDIKWFEETAKKNSPAQNQKIWNTKNSGNLTFTKVDNKGYNRGSLLGKTYAAHRIIWLWYYGELLTPEVDIDHKNHRRTDNRILNLGKVSRQQNLKNRSISSKNSTGFHGIWWDKDRNKYQVKICHSYKQIFLGRFSTLEEAIDARKKAEIKYGFDKNHGK